MPNAKAPTAAEVEAAAREFDELQTQIAAIRQKADTEAEPFEARVRILRALLLGQVKEFGDPHAEKSKLLHGLEWEVMASFGTRAVVDGKAVEEFRQALVKEKKPALLNRIFVKAIRWSLADTADAFIRDAHGTGKFSDKLYALYARCNVIEQTTPHLEIRKK